MNSKKGRINSILQYKFLHIKKKDLHLPGMHVGVYSGLSHVKIEDTEAISAILRILDPFFKEYHTKRAKRSFFTVSHTNNSYLSK